MRYRDHVIEVRVARDDRRGRVFHQVRQSRVRVPAPQRADHRRREHDIANQPQADQKEVHSPFDGRFIHEHDGDVVFDRIHAAARVTAQTGAVLHEPNGCLALGTDEDLEQRGVDSHERQYS